MPKLPEYLLSTPRLVLLLFTLALIGLTYAGKVQPSDFVTMVGVVVGYFFGARGKEEKKDDPGNPMASGVN